jgi:hypothetical protein
MEKKPFVFQRINFLIFFVGLALMAVGYLLMVGGGSDDPNVFNEEIFSTRRIRVAPLLIILGFIVEVIAIMYQPKKEA